MQINLDESITVLAKRVERLRGLNTHWEMEVKIKLDRVKEALAQVESLLTPRATDASPKSLPKNKRKVASRH